MNFIVRFIVGAGIVGFFIGLWSIGGMMFAANVVDIWISTLYKEDEK